MDILKSEFQASPQWFPYFGNQSRVADFIAGAFEWIGVRSGDSVFETNAGSHAISYVLNQRFGTHAIANDLGYYSNLIGKALTGDMEAAKIVAKIASTIELEGYQPEKVNEYHAMKWLDFIEKLPKAKNYENIRGNLFETMKPADFIYCDFAWPWKDGTYTEEYEYTADRIGSLYGDTLVSEFKMASARRILQDVIEYLDKARKMAKKYVLLSNQSSNYPTFAVLETHMKACGHEWIAQRNQMHKATFMDDCGKDKYFTEYLYIFEPN